MVVGFQGMVVVDAWGESKDQLPIPQLLRQNVQPSTDQTPQPLQKKTHTLFSPGGQTHISLVLRFTQQPVTLRVFCMQGHAFLFGGSGVPSHTEDCL